jgi:hypothetical protein
MFSRIAESPTFIALNAHCWFAFAVVAIALRFHANLLAVLFIAVPLAAFKEFYIDLKYESDPPQTLADSVDDFCGYMTGFIIGAVYAIH